jgi:ankyrin repeat protein
MTPFMWAMAYGRWKTAELLLDAGANPTAKDGGGHDAFILAALFSRADNLRKFLSRFPDYNVNRRCNLGDAALGMVLGHGVGALSTVQILLNSGAKMPALPLHFVASNPDMDPDLVQWLLNYEDCLARKLNLQNYPRSKAWSAAHRIARAFSFCGYKNNMVEVLAWQHGGTPLHYATAFGHFSTAQVLVAAAARRDIKNAQGALPEELGLRIHGNREGYVIEKPLRIKSGRGASQRRESSHFTVT